ncbi:MULTISPECIES: GNAT family N-acetyltransferase [Microbulbifer]|uniref:GNAT family N-acetyltransferase n=1 Tax=Microbulbifer celer TaxID=435905 RepID=A0ABW3UBI9_9GAMM|nr:MULTISPECIES: GNAT family N-acetyltransferase [Microbulbifer]UFN56993.1 GNAT family N-acetyltransferase [Microbulbifer celer]
MLRPLETTDIDRLGQLWLHLACTHHPSLPVSYWEARLQDTLEQLQRLYAAMQSSGFSHVSANDEPRLTAWVYANPRDDIAEGLVAITPDNELHTVFVAPTQQRQGIGSTLMAQAMYDRNQLEVTVLEENLHGRYFLQKHGFEETARSYSMEARQDELVMMCRAA